MNLSHEDAKLGIWKTELDQQGAWDDSEFFSIVKTIVQAGKAVHDLYGTRPDNVLMSVDLMSLLCQNADTVARIRHSKRSWEIDLVMSRLLDVDNFSIDMSVQAWTDWTGYVDKQNPIARERWADSHSRMDYKMRNCVLVWASSAAKDNKNAGALLYNCSRYLPCSASAP